MGTKKYVEGGFGYGKSEYEVSFGLAPRNGELYPSDPETPDSFNSPFRDRNPEQSSDLNFPKNLGSVGQNVGARGIYKGRLFFVSRRFASRIHEISDLKKKLSCSVLEPDTRS